MTLRLSASVSSAILIFVFVTHPVASAETYPWAETRAGDIHLISDPYVEEAARLHLIASATRSIDVITYDQRTDARVGMPILNALREAADRGVHIRFMSAWFSTFNKDSKRLAPKFLLDPPTVGGVEYVVVGGPQLEKQGYKIDDEVHEKILLVDGKRALLTGRGQTDAYMNWLDTAFLLRGDLIKQVSDCFEKTWTAVRNELPIYTTQAGSSLSRVQKAKRAMEAAPVWTPSVVQAAQVADLDRWLQDETVGPTNGRARLLHFDLLKQLRELGGKPRSHSFRDRVEQLTDPVIDALVERVSHGQEIAINTISFLLHPKLKAALYGAAARGAHVRVLTNGKGAYKGVLPLPMPWFAGLPDLDDALHQGVEAFSFTRRSETPWIYLHRKVAIVDDTVIIGSHNFNLPSSLTNDEMSVEIEDPALAARLQGLFETSLSENGKRLDPGQIHRERKRSALWTQIAKPIIGLF